MNVTFVGCGYVGLINCLSIAYKNKKSNFICFDTNKKKIYSCQNKKIPFYEPKLNELINKVNNVKFTINEEDAYKNADIIFICVGTPQNDEGDWDLTAVYKSIDCIYKYNNKASIVIKSTVPIGTCNDIRKYISRIYHVDPIVINNPEFLSQGNAIYDCFKPNRIIIGYDGNKTRIKNFLTLFDSYKNIKKFIISTKDSEMSKISANNFLAVKLSFFNEISNICRENGISIFNVIETMKYDDRIGDKYMTPSVGYGGSCLPKDSVALYNWSLKNGYCADLIKASINLNKNQIKFVLYLFKKLILNFNDKISILGLSFKENTGDIRDSASIDTIEGLLPNYKNICVYDKYAISETKKIFDNKIKYFRTIPSCIKNSKCIIIMTADKDFTLLNKLVNDNTIVINTTKSIKLKNKINQVRLNY